MIITATKVVLIQLFSYMVVSKQKIKMKAQNTMVPSYHSKFITTQNNGVPFFSCLGPRCLGVVLYLHVWVKSKFGSRRYF